MSKSALVTGASSGIGTAIALDLAAKGYIVHAHYNSSLENAEKVLAQLKKINPACSLVRFDIADANQVTEACQNVDVDVLVNNAGLHIDQHALLMSHDSFDQVLKTNLYGPFYLSKILGKKMILRRSGCIVNISSLAGQTGNIGQANYAASKAGLIALTKTMAMELGPRGIRVNAVAPGLIDTDMIKTISNLDDYKKKIPLGRFGTVQEVASVVSFLCSDEASYITGHTLSVNGGLFPS